MSTAEERAQFGDLIDQLEREAMDLDGGGDSAGVHLLFRTLHNLKSLAAYMGLKDLTASLHKLEDGLDAIRRGREVWSATWADEVFALIDKARSIPGAGEVPAPPAPRERVRAVAPASPWGLPLTEAEAETLADATLQGMGVYRIEKLFKSGLSREAFLGLPVMEDVAELGLPVAVHPTWEAYAQGPEEQVVKILFASHRTHQELGRILFDPLLELQAPHPAPLPVPEEELRCLVIEDDTPTGAVLSHIMKKHGSCMVVGTARGGYAQFLKAWERTEPYQIMFIDLGLPDVGGLAILSAVRRFESEHHIPRNRRCMVLVCTGSMEVEDIKASLVLEADGYLVKPVSLEAIEEKVALIKETWLAEN